LLFVWYGPISRVPEVWSTRGTSPTRSLRWRSRTPLLLLLLLLGVLLPLLLDADVSAFLLVLNPDRLAVLETIKAHDLLTRFKVPVTGLVVNRVLPTDADGAFLNARRRQEAPYLEQIDQIFGRLPRVRVPLLADEVRDMETLLQLGRSIVSADDP